MTLQGLWNGLASTADGDEIRFRLDLSLDGETVQVGGPASDASGSGTFRDGNLTLTLKDEEGTFVLEGRLDAGTLTGYLAARGRSTPWDLVSLAGGYNTCRRAFAGPRRA